jgi:hypothetical protein
MFAPFWP